jgi:transcriptional regulator with XRE-family HTH domain
MEPESVIRHFRKKAEISVSELSRRVGVTITAASNWDHGNSFPRFKTLVKVADALGVTPDALLKSPDRAEQPVEAVEFILRDTKAKLARALGMAENRIQLELRIQG